MLRRNTGTALVRTITALAMTSLYTSTASYVTLVSAGAGPVGGLSGDFTLSGRSFSIGMATVRRRLWRGGARPQPAAADEPSEK